jgi:hypothetical protein
MRKWKACAIALLLASVCSTSCNIATCPSNTSPLEPPSALTQTSLLATPTTVLPPTPSSSEVGTVVGFLLEGSDDPRPVTGAILYLGEVVRLADGTPAMAKLNRQSAPSTQTDANGRFVFTDVSAGQRTLFLDLVTRAVNLGHPPAGGDLIIDVKGGKTVDLGKLVYPELPSTP